MRKLIINFMGFQIKWKIVLTIIISIFISLVIEVFIFNYSYFTMNNSDRGVFEIKNYIVNDGKIFVNSGLNYISKLLLTTKTNEISNFKINFDSLKPNFEIVESIEGFIIPEITQKYVNLYVNSGEFYIEIDANKIIVEKIEILNQISFSFQRFLYINMMVLFVFLMIIFKTEIMRRIEFGFLITALFVGLSYSLLVPPITGISWDDQIHLINSFILLSQSETSNISTAVFDAYTIKYRSYYFNNEHDWNNYKNLVNNKNMELNTISVNNDNSKKRFTGYIASAVGVSLARALSLSFTTQILIGRLANLFIYIGLVFYAIMKSKHFKLSLAMIGLIPTTIFLASSYSYDSISIGGIMLVTVLVFDQVFTKKKYIQWKDVILIHIVLFFAIFHKAIYFPFFLIYYLVPINKFKTMKFYIQSTIINIFLLGVTISVFILPTILFPDLQTGDFRGGNVDPAGQINFIFNNIFLFLKIIAVNVKSVFIYALFEYPFRDIYNLGLIDYSLSFLLLLLVIIVMILDNNVFDSVNYKKLSFIKETGVYLGIILLIVLIYTALYIDFNVVGTEIIRGVQNRYFFPLFPLIIFLIKPFKQYKIDISIHKLAYFSYIAYALLMSISIYQMVVERFWS